MRDGDEILMVMNENAFHGVQRVCLGYGNRLSAASEGIEGFLLRVAIFGTSNSSLNRE